MKLNIIKSILIFFSISFSANVQSESDVIIHTDSNIDVSSKIPSVNFTSPVEIAEYTGNFDNMILSNGNDKMIAYITGNGILEKNDKNNDIWKFPNNDSFGFSLHIIPTKNGGKSIINSNGANMSHVGKSKPFYYNSKNPYDSTVNTSFSFNSIGGKFTVNIYALKKT